MTTPPPPARWLLWASLLGPPLLWLAAFLAAFAFGESACGALRNAAGGGGDAAHAVLLWGTLAAAFACGASTLFAHRIHRRAVRSRPAFDDFLPRLGFAAGLLFTFVLVMQLVPIAMLGVCR